MWLVVMTPPPTIGYLFRRPSRSGIGARNVQKSTVLGTLKNFLSSIKLSKSIKTITFFEKVKNFDQSWHETTLVIPEDWKLIFEKQCSTTKFCRRDTTFQTKIATVLDAWTLTFQCFWKTLFFSFSIVSFLVPCEKIFWWTENVEDFTVLDSFLTWSCHVNTLVLPEEQKNIFENQVSTTEFRHRGTASLTKISTVLMPEHPLFNVCKNIMFFISSGFALLYLWKYFQVDRKVMDLTVLSQKVTSK